MPRTNKTFEERFTEKVDKSSGCWLWVGAKSKSGYGTFQIDRKPMLPHRFSYEFYNGPIPNGSLIRHTCDNKLCCNPAHLITGSQKDNMRDCVERGRTWQQQVTHCPQGHEYTPENTLMQKGSRLCRECGRAKARVYAAAKRARAKQ